MIEGDGEPEMLESVGKFVNLTQRAGNIPVEYVEVLGSVLGHWRIRVTRLCGSVGQFVGCTEKLQFVDSGKCLQVLESAGKFG